MKRKILISRLQAAWRALFGKVESTMSLGVYVQQCTECDKFNKAIEIFNMLRWECVGKAIGYDEERGVIMLDQAMMMSAIQLANPGQQERPIELCNRNAWKTLKVGEDIVAGIAEGMKNPYPFPDLYTNIEKDGG